MLIICKSCNNNIFMLPAVYMGVKLWGELHNEELHNL